MTPTSFARTPTPTGKVVLPILLALTPSIHLTSVPVATIQYTPFAFVPFIAARSRSGEAVSSSPVDASTTIRVVRLVKWSIGGRVRMFGSTDQLPWAWVRVRTWVVPVAVLAKRCNEGDVDSAEVIILRELRVAAVGSGAHHSSYRYSS